MALLEDDCLYNNGPVVKLSLGDDTSYPRWLGNDKARNRDHRYQRFAYAYSGYGSWRLHVLSVGMHFHGYAVVTRYPGRAQQ